MSTTFFPLEGCLATATGIRTAMANSVIHLFTTALTPDPSTPTSAYTAAEANYDGYVPITFTAWNAAILAPGTGYMIGSPLVQFAWAFVSGSVGNIINGCYVLDASGKNRYVVVFTAPIPMEVAGQGIPLNLVWLFPTGL